MREFGAPNGVRWTVYAVTPGEHYRGPAGAFHVREELQEGWLCFEGAGEKRRFYPIPPEWETLSDAHLWLLCRCSVPSTAS